MRGNGSIDASPEHPRLGLNLAEPVLDRGNSPEVFEDVLLADEPDWDYPAGRRGHRGAEEGLQLEDALGMVAQSPVPKVRHVLFAGVEKLVVDQEVARLAAELLG
jgi:hypothetical protein